MLTSNPQREIIVVVGRIGSFGRQLDVVLALFRIHFIPSS
jgi:hypothetical protein